MAAVMSLGRLPEIEEFAEAPVVAEHFGSLKRAFAVVRRVTAEAEWQSIAQRTLRADMRAFFGTYASACRLADELLFRAGDPAAIDEACKRSPIGKLLPDDLYIHRSALDHLEPLLRIYEGCGRAYLGEVEGANIIKIHRRSGKLSYLVYPDFEIDPHPALLRCVKLSLRTRQLECYDYTQSKNPPILHRKETFLHPDHPLHLKFAWLTQQ